jgi:hypothetical protein
MPTDTNRRPGHATCEPCGCVTYKSDHCRHDHDPWTADSARAEQ